MTGKEFQKLRRQELLELLLEAGREIARLQSEHEAIDSELQMLEESNQRLGAKIDQKDGVIHKLQGRLERKDEKISVLEREIEELLADKREKMERAGDVAGAVLALNDIFEIAQKAADQYLYNVKQKYEE